MVNDVLALIPARSGSKGIPDKNFRRLADGAHPMGRALACAKDAGLVRVISSDHPEITVFHAPPHQYAIQRPAALAQDDTPMIDVVKHALEHVSGPPEQIVLLIQPTQPLRKPSHLIQAIELLRSSGADSVVSAVELPQTHNPEFARFITEDGYLMRWLGVNEPTRRQDASKAYIRDGTVYAFWRHTVERFGTIYGRDVRPLIIPARESCPLDTMDDWLEAERRLRDLP